jgi:hypothetical protein
MGPLRQRSAALPSGDACHRMRQACHHLFLLPSSSLLCRVSLALRLASNALL